MMFFSKAPSMTLGIAALAAPGRGPRDDLWLGCAAGEPIPWRVLSREGNGGWYRNAAGEEVSGPALLLVTSCLLGNHFQDGIKKDSDLRFYQEGTEPDTQDPALLWRQSAARAWCGDLFESCLSAPDGVARDYRTIARPAAPDGVARLDLAGLKRKKGDRLLVFSERQEEKQVTGYASPLIQVPEN